MPKKSRDLKKMLPSKQFVKAISLCVGSCIIILILANYFGSRSAFSQPLVSVGQNATVSDLLTQDSNNNGIPDWEESLYGLNPKGDGIANKKIIDEKKLKAEQENGVTNDDSDSTTQTDALTREMLSTILALQQSGNLTPEAISNLSDTLGENVDAKRDTAPEYTIDNISTTDDTSQSMAEYEKEFSAALKTAQASGAGNELSVIYQGLDPATGKDAIKNLDSYADAYDKLGSDIIAIKTPEKISQKSLALANACALMAHSLRKIEVMYTDAATGLVGFDEYSTASAAVVSGTSDLTDSFSS